MYICEQPPPMRKGTLSELPDKIITKGPRWPWITHLNLLDDPSQFFFVAFREEFTRISLCLYSASRPHSLIPCSLIDHNFPNNF